MPWPDMWRRRDGLDLELVIMWNRIHNRVRVAPPLLSSFSFPFGTQSEKIMLYKASRALYIGTPASGGGGGGGVVSYPDPCT